MKKVLFMLPAVTLATLASCSSDESSPVAGTPGNEIRVTTEVMDLSRAGHTTDNLTSFGLIIGSDNEIFSYHKQMTKAGTEWSAADAAPMYWEDQAKAVDVIAYAPYRADELNSKSKIEIDVEADQSTEEGVKTSDFIAMKKPGFVPQSGLNAEGKLAVAMAHMMSKVYINVEYPEFYDQADAANPMQSLTVDGLKVNATLDLGAWDGTREAATLAIDPNSAAETMTPYASGFDAAARKVSYEFIAVPQTANAEIKFMIAGTPYSWTATGLDLRSGYATTINLSIDKTGVSTDKDVTVDPWEEGGSISGKPEQGAEAFTVKEMTNKPDWQWVYSSQSPNYWGGDRGIKNLWDGVSGEGPALDHCWLSHEIVKGTGMAAEYRPPFEGRYLEAFCVIDLGKTEWIAGIGAITSGFGDTTWERAEFYATDAATIDNSSISEQERGNLICSNEFAGDVNGIKTVMDKVFAIDDQLTWTKIGELSTGGDFSAWKEYRKDFSEAELDASPVKTRYIKVVFVPYAYPQAVGNYCERVSCGEIYLKHVTAKAGVAVD